MGGNQPQPAGYINTTSTDKRAKQFKTVVKEQGKEEKKMHLMFVLALALLNCGVSGWTDSCYSNEAKCPFVFKAGNCHRQLDEATCTMVTVLCCRNLELYPSATHEAAAQATCTDDRYLCIEPDPRGVEVNLLQEKEAHPRLKTIIMFATVTSFMLAAIVISVMCCLREMRARRDEPGLGAPIQCTQDSPSRWTWNS